MAGMVHVAVLLLLLADVVQLQVSETAGSDGATRTISDEALAKIVEESNAKVEADFQNIMAYKQCSVLAGGAGGSAGNGSAAKPAMTTLGNETGTSTMAAADFHAFFIEAAGDTLEALRAGEKWQEVVRRLNFTGVKDQDGKFSFPVQLSESQFQMISQKFDKCCPQRCPGNDGYRTITGACNNRKNAHLGSANRAFGRWLPAQYDDGVGQPQGWSKEKLRNGYPLPEPRDVSNAIIPYKPKDTVLDKMYPAMVSQFSQFIEHDLLSLTQATFKLEQTSCENKGNQFPVLIPHDDPSSINYQRSCMPFVRTAAAPPDRSLTRQQLNGVTPFMDASNVYGSEECQSKTLRNTKSLLGLLKVNTLVNDNGRAFLPYVNEMEDFCLPGIACAHSNPCSLLNPEKNISCFLGGDRSVNHNLGQMALNTVFLREHNRLAEELKHVNAHWDGERLYQESRKIVVAEQQAILVNEYLPMLLGDRTKDELPPYSGYDETVDPTISNVFALAFRPLHGTIAQYAYFVDPQYNVYKNILFRKTHFATWIPVEDGFDAVIRGMLMSKAKLITQDATVTAAQNDSAPGLDLTAFKINRCRDHGLPRYNDWREYCGLSQPRNEKELAAVLNNAMLAKKLMELYKTPNNIDICVGLICEPPVDNGTAGPLQICLLGEQFRKIRDGDRYWFENTGVFTKEQLSALRRVTLARVLCDNTNMGKMPRKAFAPNGPKDFVDCKEIKALDLSAWAEDKTSGDSKEFTIRARL